MQYITNLLTTNKTNINNIIDNYIDVSSNPPRSEPQSPPLYRKHTSKNRTFYRLKGDNSSLTLTEPVEGFFETKEESGPNQEWFNERWKMLQQKNSNDHLPDIFEYDGAIYRINSTVPSIFKNHIYFTESNPKSGLPELLMTAHDFDIAKKEAHSGAFGSDYKEIDLNGKPWTRVWKFPNDLNRMEGYLPIYNIWLPVGTYPFINDSFIKLNSSHLDNKNLCKWRKDIYENLSVHKLEDVDTGKEYGMIGTIYFVAGYNRISEKDIVNLYNIITELRSIGLPAFSVYGQHHAIVFDMSPNKLSDTIKSNQDFKSILLKYCKHDYRDKLQEWINNY